MQSQNLYTTDSPIKATSENKKSFEQISNEIAQAAEKRQFIKTIAITVMIFTGISAIAIGYLITQRFNNVNAQTPTKLIIKDDQVATSRVVDESRNQIVISRRPTRTPAPQSQTGSTNVFAPQTQGFFATPFLFQTPFPTPIGIVAATVTPNPSGSLTPTFTPSPTVTPSITLTPTSTLTPTITQTPVATPTGALSTSLDFSANTITYDTTNIGDSQTEEFTLQNLGLIQVGISSMTFATSGSKNPYSLINDTGTCLTNASLTYYLNTNTSKCVRVKFTPTLTSSNSNILIIYWNNTNYKLIYLNGTAGPTVTPTATSTPTPTRTPTPTP